MFISSTYIFLLLVSYKKSIVATPLWFNNLNTCFDKSSISLVNFCEISAGNSLYKLVLSSISFGFITLSAYFLIPSVLIIFSISEVCTLLVLPKTLQVNSSMFSIYSSIIILLSYLIAFSMADSNSSFLLITSIPTLLPSVAGLIIKGYEYLY